MVSLRLLQSSNLCYFVSNWLNC